MLGTFHDLNSDPYLKNTCKAFNIEFTYDIYQNLIIIRKKPKDFSDTLQDVFLGPREVIMTRENFVQLVKSFEFHKYIKKWAEE